MTTRCSFKFAIAYLYCSKYRHSSSLPCTASVLVSYNWDWPDALVLVSVGHHLQILSTAHLIRSGSCSRFQPNSGSDRGYPMNSSRISSKLSNVLRWSTACILYYWQIPRGLCPAIHSNKLKILFFSLIHWLSLLVSVPSCLFSSLLLSLYSYCSLSSLLPLYPSFSPLPLSLSCLLRSISLSLCLPLPLPTSHPPPT